MADRLPRYLVQLPGRGGLPRWFWQPSATLRAAGWRPQRVPLNWADFAEPEPLRVAACARALELNAELDSLREKAALAATRPAPPVTTRTLGELITLYKQSAAWTGLAASTRRGYQQCLGKIETWGADMPLRVIDEASVQHLKHALRATPAYANAVIRVLRLLLEHGRRQSWLRANPALRPGLAASEPMGLIWPREAVLAFVAAADAAGRPSLGTAVLLNEWLGQREGDILRLPRTAYRNGSLLIRQSKTGARVTLPVDLVPHLAARLETELARTASRQPVPTTIIVSEETGLPYKPDNFRHVFAAVRAAAAQVTQDNPRGLAFPVDYLLPGRDSADPDAFAVRMAELTFMQLRHTAVTRLAEGGCDTPLISSVTGHTQDSVTTIMARYMVRTAEMARVAFGKRMLADGIAAAVTASKEASR